MAVKKVQLDWSPGLVPKSTLNGLAKSSLRLPEAVGDQPPCTSEIPKL
jgi:hypothetical protein